jgi:16S rRNA (guanine527-N7)-methyltransferase
MVSIAESISEGARQMHLTFPDGAIERLVAFLNLLERWNRVYNLTAVRDPQAMVARHILDSLSVLPWVKGPRVLDVGSGAGLPGIPLAIVREQEHFVLLDSNRKRTRFLNQVVAELQLANVNVVHSRVEEYQPRDLFDALICRAFSSVADLLAKAGRLCAADGRILLMKGLPPDDELVDLPGNFARVAVYPLHVPGLNAVRHLVHLMPVEWTQARPSVRMGG